MSDDALAGSRRRFLRSAAGFGGAMALSQAAPAAPAALPTVKFGSTEVTRLIIGSNPFYGYSHFNSILNGFMGEYMTQDRRMEVLHRCQQAGIKTWQVHYMAQTMEDFKRYRSEGGKMNWFLLGDFEMMTDFSLIGKVAKEHKPIGIAHHGNRTDERFQARQMDKVKDFCKAVRDSGVMVGVSAHNPAVFDSIEGENWDVDYYQACLYRVTRTRAEARKEFGESPVDIGGMFMEKDPERMCKVIRQTKKPCLAFKLLGAGRNTDRPATIANAFKFAFDNIKPTDAVIVGMCPRFKDEITENAALTVKFGQKT
jgi:hypothetical protein